MTTVLHLPILPKRNDKRSGYTSLKLASEP